MTPAEVFIAYMNVAISVGHRKELKTLNVQLFLLLDIFYLIFFKKRFLIKAENVICNRSRNSRNLGLQTSRGVVVSVMDSCRDDPWSIPEYECFSFIVLGFKNFSSKKLIVVISVLIFKL